MKDDFTSPPTALLKDFIGDESGQGITEYGTLLAFAAMLIAAFFLASGSLATAVSKAFANLVSQLGKIDP